MPAEIIQFNSRVAEVRLICDQCRKLIGTCLLPKEEAEAQIKEPIICRQCKQTKKQK